MAALSLVIRNARIVDGTGRPAYLGDVAIAGDRIADIAPSITADVPTVDAGGRVLSPGFIEVHTHFDPQLCWDRLATPSLEHGTTTLVCGNCSLSLAPVRTGEGDRLSRMFSKIEDIGAAFFKASVPYSWETFPQFLEFIRPNLGINVGALVGHTPLRHYVMGDAAQQRPATDVEIDRMCGVLAESIQGGALGLSLSYADSDENGALVASCFADVRERTALARTVVANGRRFVQSVREFMDPDIQTKHVEELGRISLGSGALCATSPIVDQPFSPGKWKSDILQFEELRRAGAHVIGQTSPRSIDMSFRLSRALFILYMMPTWADIMGRPVADRISRFRNALLRAALDEESRTMMLVLRGTFVTSVISDRNQPYVGRSVTDIAKAQGRSFSDTLIDIALEDELETDFSIRDVVHADLDNVATLLNHPLIQIGASDAGAHVAQFAGSGDSPYVLEHFVRRHSKMTLEHAIKRMTSEIAEDVAITDRGVVAKGKFADLILFDPTTITRGEEELISDLPGGGTRYMRHPKGIDKVIVNGQIVVDGGSYTKARPGRIV
jgi:N-acyl-D-amino-acid deacylase